MAPVKGDREERKYVCGYPGCGKVFKKWVGTSTGDKHSKVSTQVQCPRCGNFLPNGDGK